MTYDLQAVAIACTLTSEQIIILLIYLSPFQIREDLTVIMVAPKCPGTEVREEYKRGFGVPTLIAVHPPNDPHGHGLEWAKAYASATGGDRAGVLESSFVAEVKSDLMGEQTILCGTWRRRSAMIVEEVE
jgi:ketol-acid reductoisomerase